MRAVDRESFDGLPWAAQQVLTEVEWSFDRVMRFVLVRGHGEEVV